MADKEGIFGLPSSPTTLQASSPPTSSGTSPATDTSESSFGSLPPTPQATTGNSSRATTPAIINLIDRISQGTTDSTYQAMAQDTAHSNLSPPTTQAAAGNTSQAYDTAMANLMSQYRQYRPQATAGSTNQATAHSNLFPPTPQATAGSASQATIDSHQLFPILRRVQFAPEFTRVSGLSDSPLSRNSQATSTSQSTGASRATDTTLSPSNHVSSFRPPSLYDSIYHRAAQGTGTQLPTGTRLPTGAPPLTASPPLYPPSRATVLPPLCPSYQYMNPVQPAPSIATDTSGSLGCHPTPLRGTGTSGAPSTLKALVASRKISEMASKQSPPVPFDR